MFLPPSSPEVRAATVIQKTWRCYQFKITQLPKDQQQDCSVMISGNAPKIIGLPHPHRKDEKVALISMSGFRSVELACQLSEGYVKLIIIDNSKKVVDFWRKSRDLMNY
jgi:hypothetical protein